MIDESGYSCTADISLFTGSTAPANCDFDLDWVHREWCEGSETRYSWSEGGENNYTLTTVNGEVVSMSTSNGAPILLDVGGPCTGVQGIIAFGMLSTMALLDLKPTMARLIPVFALGFAGAFLINIVRLLLMFLTYEFASLDVAITLHIYVGYIVFIAWVVAFWAIAFRYLVPRGQVTRPGSGQAP